MNNVVKSYIVITFLVIFLASMTFVNAQRIIVLENDKGVQKSSFLRGEGIVVSVTLPYDARVDVWLHTPPGTPGPSPIQLIQGALVRANIQEKLGPMWMDEKAPCGKYQFELRILDSQGRLTTEYRFFDYAMNEQPCATTATTITTTTITTTTITTTKDITVIIAGISGVAIAVVVALIVIYMLRAGARPPKERAPVAPPVAPPTPPPSPPPKTPYKRRPIVRGESREEEET